MNFLNNFFRKKDEVNSYETFWNWFQANEQKFFDTVKNQHNIENNFFDKLSPQLNKIKSDLFFFNRNGG